MNNTSNLAEISTVVSGAGKVSAPTRFVGEDGGNRGGASVDFVGDRARLDFGLTGDAGRRAFVVNATAGDAARRAFVGDAGRCAVEMESDGPIRVSSAFWA